MRNWFLAALLLQAGLCLGADWPMWRHNAARTAATDEELPAELHLQWVWKYPKLEPMWSGCMSLANRGREVGFETFYSPIVMGTTMFVGSSHNDTLTAIDAETGAEKWRFYAEGPVRAAPAGWNGKVYVTSDDGFLYCLDAGTGKLVWKFRGAPMKHRIIGDERLVSAWPARGGPAIVDGKVYFSAGIWPFMKIHIHALDAETGKKVWANERSGDKCWPYKGGTGEKTSPQGPLAVVGDRILLPNNRLGATALDRMTGEFSYALKTRHLWRICGAGKYLVTEGHRGIGAFMYELDTGRVLGQLSGIPVLSGEMLFWAGGKNSRGEVGARDLTKATSTKPGDKKSKIEIPELWKLDGIQTDGRGYLQMKMKAGTRLYAASGGRITAVDMPAGDSKAKVSWTGQVEGEIEELLAVSGRLFAVTREGGIYCFGAEKTTPKTYTVEKKELPAGAEEWKAKAGKILDHTGIRDGYALVLGIGSGRLMEELVRQSELVVIGVDPDAKKADALRRKLDAAGLYGSRAQVLVGDPVDCGLPPYLAGLIVSEDMDAAGAKQGAGFVQKVFYSLRPYGGVACLADGRVESAGLEGAKVTQAGEFTLLTRAGALPGSAPWTHQNADAGNTMSSRDDLVKAPLGLLWFGGPSTALSFDRHYMGPRPHVVGGRMIVLGADGLTAIDVYTGRFLWRAKTPEILELAKPYQPGHKDKVIGSNALGSYYASVPDGIYLASGAVCMRFDPATGKRVSKIKLPSDKGMKEFGPVRVSGDVLVAAIDPMQEGESLFRIAGKPNRQASRQVAAFDRNTGELLWSVKGEQGFGHNAIAAGGGMVFCIDHWVTDPEAQPRAGKLTAFDARTGKPVWNTTENVFGIGVSYVPECGVVVQSAGLTKGALSYGNRNSTRAIVYDAKAGSVLWDGSGGRGPWMLNGTMLISQSSAIIDLRTGKRIRTYKNTIGGKGCSYQIGNAHVVSTRRGSASYVDIDTNTSYRLGGFRSGCMNTLIPADGVLCYPYFARNCSCAANIRTSLGLIHMPELAPDGKAGN